ncbi:glycine cleavage system protein GcvH [Epidermidibacterium keratini]|uniref:Glycine cleavage system H protein n=1 Tax=Epidermidibacterium keratini TaxID=1891644 RepID=A0A7L4YSF7_9ACTN|nr:glycine cleavage system protein GcvH [Epidermidibacterium keratini]QHC02165.1 glycine cleavage system protein GcvH [Epidermidibacterium keratini]
MIPEDLKYTAEHEWVKSGGDLEEGVVRIGITDHAQDSLGDIVFIELPEPGSTITAGESCGEVESTKSVSELFAPVSGEVLTRNEALESAPETVNSDPYGAGWMFEVRIEGAAALDGLLDAKAYGEIVAQA